MLYELDSIYCSRCKEFTPVFDAFNYDFSAIEIICSNCGTILLIMKTKYQNSFEQDFNASRIETYLQKENQRSAKKVKMQKIMTGTNSA